MAKASLEKSLISYSILISLIININFQIFLYNKCSNLHFCIKVRLQIFKKKEKFRMGPRQSTQRSSKQQQFLSNYEIIQQLPNQNIRFLQHKQTKKQFLLRQLSYNAKPQYLKAIQTIKTKKQQLKDADHVAPIAQYFQKEQDQYCSTFYKLYVLFQYPQRTLEDQINQRNLRKNSFSQTQLWSILASCILGLSHLQRKGIRHGSLKSSMIFLSQQGHIKVSDPFTTGCQNNYQTLLNKRSTRHVYLSPEQCQALQSQIIAPSQINQYKSDIFTLGMIVLQCGLLQYQDECYRDEYSRIHFQTLEYNKNRFRRIYSQQLGNMLDYMLGVEVSSRPEWIQLQNYVITDNMGQSFINQGRRSVIVGYSKPVSVNVNSKFNPGLQSLQANNFVQKKQISAIQTVMGSVQKPIKQQRPINSNQPIVLNKGIGISNSKPLSVQNNFNQISSNSFQTLRPEFSSNQYRMANNIVQDVQLFNKPKSIINNYHPSYNNNPSLISTNLSQFNLPNYQMPLSNFPSSISNLPNFSKPYITQSPIKNQILSKNYDITPAVVSNISNSRPLRSVFPNPYYETKTKVDQNLVQVEDDQQTSRTVSDANRYQTSRNTRNQSNSYTENQSSNYGNRQVLINSNQKFSNSNHRLGYNDSSSYKSQFNVINQNNGMHNNTMTNNPTLQHQNLSNLGNHLAEQKKYNMVFSNCSQPFMVQNPQFIKKQNQQSKVIQGQFVMETFKLGSRYEGYKLNGMRHGPGKFFYQDGGMYDGNWVKNKMQGYGKLYYQSGKIAYDGRWIQDQFTGHGTLYNENPDPLNQPFDYQNFDNVQELWTKYQGQFCEDSKNGKGVLYLSNGQYFEGNFVNDTAEGEGVYTTIKGNQLRGLWQNNLLIQQF